jgi:2-polyprenyl-3-methyl-5-hydroxy-6-metoxy-1,4-benzoquinol methylase
MDAAKAYEVHARKFLDARDSSLVGADVVERWASTLPAETEVVEIACGGGYPITRALTESGLSVWAIDASPTLLETFRSRFPNIPTQCSSVLESNYFARKFGAAISIGLIFLLKEPEQMAMLQCVSEILLPSGRFLFTAPVEVGTRQDLTTGQECRSLGRDRYVHALNEAGLRLVGTYIDEGKSNYYEAEKVRKPMPKNTA